MANNRFAVVCNDAETDSLSYDSGFTYSDRSSFVEVPDGCLRLDLPKALLRQLSGLFDNGDISEMSTTVDLRIELCLEIFEAASKKPSSIGQYEDTENDQLLALELHTSINGAERKQATAADRATYERLIREFSSLKGVDMWTIFSDNCFSYEATRDLLAAFSAEQPAQKPSAWADVKDLKIAWDNATKITTPPLVIQKNAKVLELFQKSNGQIQVKGKYTSFPALQAEVQELMKRSKEKHAKHRQLMQQAAKYFRNSKTRLASDPYSMRAADLHREAKGLLDEANQKLYDYNLNVAVNTIDVHWMNVEWTISLLDAKLAKMDRDPKFKNKSSPKRLHVITGYGSSIGANGNIQPAVKNWLSKKGYQYTNTNIGALEVICK